MKISQFLLFTVSIAAALAATQARAQNSLTAQLTNIIPGLTINGTLNGGGLQDYRTGTMNFADQTHSVTFDAFCVDPLRSMAFNDVAVYDIQDPSTLTNNDTIARLVSRYLASSLSDDEAAAAQWAIWEITTEASATKSLSSGSGNVYITSPAGDSTIALGNSYLSNYSTYSPASLTYLTSTTGQNIVSWNAVPEPSTVGLAGLSGLLLLRRRRA